MIADVSRDAIRSRFEEWLDRVLKPEEPPAGIDAEILESLSSDAAQPESPETGSYALWAAMTALTQEVKLQGRAFKELTATFASQLPPREIERKCRREILGALLDLRDRLERGAESARQCMPEINKPARKNWRDRLFPKEPQRNPAEEAVRALIKGYELGMDRLDQTLADFNAQPITCLGQPFDPRRMNAVDKEERAGVPDGSVIEVYRNGYEWNGEVFRPAQVKVAVAPRGPAGTSAIAN